MRSDVVTRWLPLLLAPSLALGEGQIIDPQTIAWDPYPEPARVVATEVEQCWGTQCTTKHTTGTSVPLELRQESALSILTVRARALPASSADQPSDWATLAYQYPGDITATQAKLERTLQPMPGTTPPTSIWAPDDAPSTDDGGPDSPVELGVRFRSDVDGEITGIRFYKASANIGTHVGNLWSSAGTKLASATFIDETASGWQQARFSAPVPITAGTEYVASYHASYGHYSADQGAFSTSAIESGPLHATAGVYAYGDASVFPAQTWNDTNYWVDVVFQSEVGLGADPR